MTKLWKVLKTSQKRSEKLEQTAIKKTNDFFGKRHIHKMGKVIVYNGEEVVKLVYMEVYKEEKEKRSLKMEALMRDRVQKFDRIVGN